MASGLVMAAALSKYRVGGDEVVVLVTAWACSSVELTYLETLTACRTLTRGDAAILSDVGRFDRLLLTITGIGFKQLSVGCVAAGRLVQKRSSIRSANS